MRARRGAERALVEHIIPIMPARTRRQPGRKFYVASAALAAASWFMTPLPDAIASAIVNTIPVEEDIDLGAQAVRAAGYRLQNPCRAGRRCVDDVGRQVVEAVLRNHPQLASAIAQYDWRFAVTDQRFVNAFAYPGGRIFVTRGLLDLCDDDELAAVIGHEVGHVLHRHSQKRYVQSRLGRVLLSALVFGDGDGRSESFGMEAAGVLLQHASALQHTSYSRANEYEADEVAWFACTALQRAGGGCRRGSLQAFFRKLDGGQAATAWDSTHPGSADRIATLDSLQARYERSAVARRPSRSDDSDFARTFAPSALAEAGSGGGALASIGSLAALIPSEAQRALLVGALWKGAALLESAWEMLMDAAAEEGTHARRRPQQRQQQRSGSRQGWSQQQQRTYYRPVD